LVHHEKGESQRSNKRGGGGKKVCSEGKRVVGGKNENRCRKRGQKNWFLERVHGENVPHQGAMTKGFWEEGVAIKGRASA